MFRLTVYGENRHVGVSLYHPSSVNDAITWGSRGCGDREGEPLGRDGGGLPEQVTRELFPE